MEVLVELQDFIKIAIPDGPGTADWMTMAKAVDRLRPLANATEDVEQDQADLTTVRRYFAMLVSNLETIFIGTFLS